MMTRAAIVGVALWCGVAAGQWPSWSSPMSGSYDRGNQALSGAVERLTVAVGPDAWMNYITTNIWASYFSQGAKLKASKAMLKAAVDVGIWTRPATNWTPETSETVTASNLLAWCGAPSGWWTNHPFVNLAAVSNGWRFLPDVASNMVWVKNTTIRTPSGQQTSTNGAIQATQTSTNIGTAFDLGSLGNTGNWNNASMRDCSYVIIDYFLPQGDYMVSFRKGITNTITSSAFCTNYQYSSDLYFSTEAPIFSGGGKLWDNGGIITATNEYGYMLWSNYPAAYRYTNTSAQIGHGEFMRSFPTNEVLAYFSDTNNYKLQVGWFIYDSVYLDKYNATTNGFKWFR